MAGKFLDDIGEFAFAHAQPAKLWGILCDTF